MVLLNVRLQASCATILAQKPASHGERADQALKESRSGQEREETLESVDSGDPRSLLYIP